MSDDPKCVAGCVPFYGGEKRHHKDCPYYPESLTKLNADRIEELEAKLAKAVDALQGLVPILCEGFEDGCGKLSRHDCAACEGYATIAELTGGKDE